MGLKEIGEGLKSALCDIGDLEGRVYPPHELPSSVACFPSALIMLGETPYHEDFSGNRRTTFRIIIVISRVDQISGVDRLLEYAEPTGAQSVKAAIEADPTLGGTADDCDVVRNIGFRPMAWDTLYMSTESEVAVYW